MGQVNASIANSIAEVKKPKAQRALERFTAAFEAQDVDKLLGAFSSECVVVLAGRDGTYNEYSGTDGVRAAFGGVLANLKNPLEMGVDGMEFDKETGIMVWHGKSSRFDYRTATNTVVVNGRGKITHFHMFYDGGKPSMVDRAKGAREWC